MIKCSFFFFLGLAKEQERNIFCCEMKFYLKVIQVEQNFSHIHKNAYQFLIRLKFLSLSPQVLKGIHNPRNNYSPSAFCIVPTVHETVSKTRF